MATRIPTEKLARVSAYDGLGTTMGMPVGALVAGPLAARIGVSATQYGAAAITLLASLLTLIARDVRTMRADSIKPVPVDLGPVDFEPVDLEPVDLEPVDLEPVDLVSAAPVPVVAAEPASQAAC
jgi:hypothetical protein